MSRIGVLVPCRDEAAVIGRKLANLARETWPASADGRPRHRILVIDDHSDDGTADRARAAAPAFASEAQVAFGVVANTVRPGKSGALQTGIELLEREVDLLVLTDADVVLEPGALEAIARAFAAEPHLAMACGSQRFVRDLADDGTARSATLGPLVDASESFDRWTGRVRRFESRSGRLFSVHGQLLAWRAELRLRPRPGIAADDLDLMLQVRARASEPRRVAFATGARFLEVKTRAGPVRRAQALRRARAFVQLVRAGAPAPSDAISRWQWALYRRIPLASPAWTAILPLVSTLLAGLLFGTGAAVASFLFFALLLTSPPGWRWMKLALLIRAATRLEAQSTLSERWTVARP